MPRSGVGGVAAGGLHFIRITYLRHHALQAEAGFLLDRYNEGTQSILGNASRSPKGEICSLLCHNCSCTEAMTSFQYLTIDRNPGNIYIITLSRKAENKLNGVFCQEIIRAFHTIHRELGPLSEGAVITRGSNEKFWCMGVDLEDPDPWSNSDGFYPVRSGLF
jgi:hypothetical protein